MNATHKEIEARFKEINPSEMIKRLLELGFEDLGEDFLTEMIFYDKDLEWVKQRKVVTQYIRLRKTNKGIKLTYKKQRQDIQTTEAKEIEFEVSDMNAAKELFLALEMVAYRTQEKRRHTFKLGDITVDLDTWPQVPTYIEIEGLNESALKETAEKLGLNWNNDVVYENAGNLIEKYYNLMVSKMKEYTFDKIEYYE
jgi:adenylate cyclase class 2